MFKKAIVVAFASLIVGCSANSVKAPVDAKAPVNGLQSYNVAESKSVAVNGKELPFIALRLKTETIVYENGKKFKDAVNDYGSAVQWNADYAVTAKHNTFAENSVYKCQEGCDIQFIKRKATGEVPVWREIVALEQITFVGIDQNDKLQSKTGFDLNTTVKTIPNKAINVHLVSTATPRGMSGGPAYSNDGAAVGILTGAVYSDTPDEKAVLVGYSVIKAEWVKFQAAQSQVTLK